MSERTFKLDPIYSIRLLTGQGEKLKELAAKRKLDRADLIREAVTEYLNKYAY